MIEIHRIQQTTLETALMGTIQINLRMALKMALGTALLETETALLETSRIIFGNLPYSTVRTGNKVLRKKLVGPLFSRDNARPFEDVMRTEFPDFLTPKEDRRKQKLAYLRRRGKGPPKKGMGKRAQKAAGGKKK